ncbi:MAG: 3-oxoacyl-[acyl-carrier-protein] reductase [Gallicola sp.]|nr:3-oxoacyl-[acyl-carrier-protein] reductase [Gallicola sp.]
MSERKKALITGGNTGIGKVVAQTLGSQYDIAINYISQEEEAILLKKELEEKGAEVLLLKADVSSFDDCQAMFDEIKEAWGGLDLLVNNAGITRDNLILRMTPEDFQAVIDVNLTGTFNCMKLASRMMSKKRSGKIISISSIVGLHGNVGQTNYAASKAGVIGMTKTLAKELAGRNVTVNAIAPGFIRTAMTDQLKDDIKEGLLATIPMKKFGESEDVAKAVAFLASEDADYITGQVLSVDGGMNI